MDVTAARNSERKFNGIMFIHYPKAARVFLQHVGEPRHPAWLHPHRIDFSYEIKIRNAEICQRVYTSFIQNESKYKSVK